MAATYTEVSRSIPSQRRSMRIVAVEVGDKIDIEGILGRSARGLKFFVTATTDIVEYKLNHLVKIEKKHGSRSRPIQPIEAPTKVWSGAPKFATYSATGATEYVTEDGLRIASIEIMSLTLGTGTVIELVVW